MTHSDHVCLSKHLDSRGPLWKLCTCECVYGVCTTRWHHYNQLSCLFKQALRFQRKHSGNMCMCQS